MRYPQNRKKAVIALALLTAFVLASCSGSGSGNSSGTISGVSLSPLVVADRVSVVDPQGGGGSPVAPAGIKALLIGLISPSQLPATSDYMTDKTTVYVNERSVKTFNSINEILCMIAQSRYDAMINKGPYLALVDLNLCSSNRDDASSAGQASTNQSSGSTMPDYRAWVVDSYRASSTSPHTVRVWVYEEATTYEPVKLILARMTITAGADTAPPYGVFKIDFQAVDPQTHVEMFKGVLIAKPDPTTGDALLRFASEDTAFHYIEKATLAKDPNGASGRGTVYKTEIRPPDATVEQFDIVYNPTHFLRHDVLGTDNEVCLDRINFDESAWRYGLYTQTGDRVPVNSGFSIKVVSNSKDYFGWVGYWGLWLPNKPDGTPLTITDGDTVYSHDFQTNTDTPYTVFQSGGKLKKHTKNSLTLDKIRNVPLVWSDCSVSPCDNYAVVTVETSPGSGLYEFWKVAKQNPAPDYTWQPFGPALLGLSTLYSSDLYFWSQALGGQVSVKLADCTFTAASGFYLCPTTQAASTPVIFYAEDIVYPGDTTVTTSGDLACFDNCPKAITDPLGGKIDPASPILPWSSSTPNIYTYDTNAEMLKYSTFDVVQKDAITGYEWGFMSGALFDPSLLTQTNPDTGNKYLACDWDINQICGWKAWSELPVFYTWETGLNLWNKFTGLIDGAGAFVPFDPPLQVRYIHNEAGHKYDGVTFYLEYNGFGNLSGIPGTCVDMDTGQPSPTGCGPDTRWVPEFTIPDDDGAAPTPNLTEVTGPNSVNYIVKALEKEQRMRELPLTDCTVTEGLTATPYPLPSITEWDPPVIGTMPNITSGPKVIGGIVQ